MNYAHVRPVRPVATTPARVRDAVLALHRQQHAASLIVPDAPEANTRQARQLLHTIGPILDRLSAEVAGVVYLASQQRKRVTEITPDEAVMSGPFVFATEPA